MTLEGTVDEPLVPVPARGKVVSARLEARLVRGNLLPFGFGTTTVDRARAEVRRKALAAEGWGNRRLGQQSSTSSGAISLFLMRKCCRR